MDFRQYLRDRATALGLDPNIAEATMMQESGGRVNAVSPKGAYGLMQVMDGAVKDVGGGFDPKVPQDNIEIGLRYLKQMKDRFGNYEGALAAYNGGPSRFDKVGRDISAMPQETRNYVPSIMARAQRSSQAASPVGQPQPEQPAPEQQPVSQQQYTASDGPSFDDFIRGMENAKAAGDESAVDYFKGQLKPKVETALMKARSAGDTQASEFFRKQRETLGVGPSLSDIGAKLYKQLSGGKEFKGTPEQAAEYAKNFQANQNNSVALGSTVAELLGGKWSDEAAVAYLDLQDLYPQKVDLSERFLRAIVPTIVDPINVLPGLGKVGQGAVKMGTKEIIEKAVSQNVLKRVATGTVAKGAGAGAAYSGGFNVAEQAARIGAGGQDSIDPVEAATATGIGATVGGALGKVVKNVSGENALEKFALRSGSVDGAKIDAELVQEIAKAADNPNFRGQPFRTEQLNTLTRGYIQEAENSIKQIGAKSLTEMGENAKVLRDALQKWKTADPAALRGTQVGDAVADAITKAQRMRSLTAEMEASGGLAKLARGALEVAPISNPIRLAGRAVLGGSQSRKQVTQDLLGKGNVKAANRIVNDLGPSGLGDSAANLSRLADEALARQQAAKSTAAPRSRAAASPAAAPANPMDKLLGKVRDENQQFADDALAQSLAPPEDLLALAARKEAPAQRNVVGDSSPIMKTIDKNAKDVESALTQARDFQQFGPAPGNVQPHSLVVSGAYV